MQSRERFGPRDGQAVTEGVIGIALLTFTFILLALLCHMNIMRTRTAMACRHAAWMAGNDRMANVGETLDYLNNYNLDNWFFFPQDTSYTRRVRRTSTVCNPNATMNTNPELLVRVEKTAGATASMKNPFSGKTAFIGNFVGAEAATLPALEVGYGIYDVAQMQKFPFNLTLVKLAIVQQDALIPVALRYATHCQWEPVSNPWYKEEEFAILEDGLEDLWDQIQNKTKLNRFNCWKLLQ